MDLEIRNHVALVVGGTGLIGTAVVSRLHAEGATPVIASRSGRDGVVMDGRDPESVDRALDLVLAQHGRVDMLIVGAAPSAQSFDSQRLSDPDYVLQAVDEKAMTFLRIATTVLPSMTARNYGRIVGIGGQNAYLTGNIAGGVRNAALIIAAKNLADSLTESGITVNVVNPGLVTPTPSSAVEPGKSGESTPDQVADLIVYLASPRSGAISGESIAVGHRIRGSNML